MSAYEPPANSQAQAFETLDEALKRFRPAVQTKRTWRWPNGRMHDDYR